MWNLIDSHDTARFYIYVRIIRKAAFGSSFSIVITGNAYDLLRR